MIDFAAMRLNMVESQLRTNKVTDRALLEAFEALPREDFAPKEKRGVAYIDEDLPIGEGRFLMEPMVLARLLQAARITKEDVVLDVGCTTGYSTALLAGLAGTVVGVEREEAMVKSANDALSSHGIDNGVVICDPLNDGYPKQAPYNVIVLQGAVAELPESITKQLADGGRLVTVMREGENVTGRATLVQRNGATLSSRALFDASTPFLPGFEKSASFVF